MRFLYSLFGFFIFLLALSFGLKNADPVTLHYYLGFAWQAPLSLMLLMTFVLGVAIGLLACLPLLTRLRRNLNELRHELGLLRQKEH